MFTRLVRYAVLLLASAASSWSVAGDTGTQKVLDTLSYWRSYYVLRPARLSPKLWKTIELPPEHRELGPWAKAGRDVNKLGLGQRYLSYTFNGHWATSPILTLMDSPPPPADWHTPAFDDSTWTRLRYPMMMKAVYADEEGDTDIGLLGVQSACFRARFFIEEPAKVRDLALRVVYRGGLIAWVNGREVGRGHVPPGPVTPETSAEEYAENAYQLPPNAESKGLPRCIADLGGSYELSRKGIHYYFAVPFTPEEYDTLVARRDRVLGPVRVDPALLRKGENVLALQAVRSDINPIVTLGKQRLGEGSHYGWAVMMKGASWLHAGVLDLSLAAAPSGAVTAERRPAGVQVWAESPHKRMFNAEFGDAGRPTRLLRLVGARQGTYSAQVVLGTDRELRGLSAKASDLAGPNGAVIPAGALFVRYAAARPVRDLALLGVERNPQWAAKEPLLCSDTWMALWRFGRRGPEGHLPYTRFGKENAQAREAAMDMVRYFDELAPEPPAAVPADSCQPVWASVKVPADAAPGTYAGTLTLSAEGLDGLAVPIRLQVMDWRLPDPTKGEDFTTMIAMEQSPWGVAKAHKVEPWSDAHYARMEHSLRRMGELGNDYLIIPVLLASEFGNREDSFVTWVRRKDGALECDFSRFDRYMDLAQKYMPKPAVVCFGVAHPEDNYLWVTPRVLFRDENTGKTAPFTVPLGEVNPHKDRREFTDEERAGLKAFWRPFIEGVMARMERRGLKNSVFWGFTWDYTLSVERNRMAFDELAPGVKWAKGCHDHRGFGERGDGGPFGFVGSICTLPQPVERLKAPVDGREYRIKSRLGWKTPVLHLSLPRTQNGVLGLEGRSVPYAWRIYPELALSGGARGICRIGADYWNATCMDGWRGGGQVGLGVVASLWPGETQAHTGARFEMLREGMQEAEARVAVEKALEGPLAASENGKRIQKTLDDRIIATMHIIRSYYTLRPSEQDFGWQERSWDLYAAAAEVTGGQAPTAADRDRFFAQAN